MCLLKTFWKGLHNPFHPSILDHPSLIILFNLPHTALIDCSAPAFNLTLWSESIVLPIKLLQITNSSTAPRSSRTVNSDAGLSGRAPYYLDQYNAGPIWSVKGHGDMPGRASSTHKSHDERSAVFKESRIGPATSIYSLVLSRFPAVWKVSGTMGGLRSGQTLCDPYSKQPFQLL